MGEHEKNIERINIIKNSIIKARRARMFVQRDMLINTAMIELGLSYNEVDYILITLIDGKFIKLADGKFIKLAEGEIFLSDEQEKELENEYCIKLGIPVWNKHKGV